MRFKIADAVVGVNCPPMHPNCRCNVVTPRETDEEVQAEIDRLLDGRSIEDIERELDRQIAEMNALPENTNNDSEPTQPDNFSTMNSAEKSAAENSQEQLTTAENGGIIEAGKEETTEKDMLTSVFHTYDDPMREVMGSAIANNRKELNDIIEDLKSIGVETIFSDDNESIGYQPCNRFSNGEPGQVKLARESSLSACLHEKQHAFDDYESGWNGRFILSFDPEEHYNWEIRAYGIEIEIAKSMGREDMVERLESLLERERKAIFDEE